MTWHLYLGTYTQKLPYVDGQGQGIYRLEMDAASGQLAFHGLAARTPNPSFVAVDAARRRLYAANELVSYRGRPAGALTAYAIQAEGGLQRLAQRSSGGPAPCYLSLDPAGRFALVANYNGGNVALLPLDSAGSLGRRACLVQHEGHGPHPERQEAPHAHSIQMDPTNTWALAADLGVDRLIVYRVSASPLQLLAHGQIPLPPGSGPRHFAFHPHGPFLYVANELASTVSVFRFEAATGNAVALQTLSTLPAGFTAPNTAADIHFEPGGRFLYVSNRGHDSLAIFAAGPDGRLAPLGQQSTLGRTPRHFAILPDGRFLLAANQDSNHLVCFRLDASGWPQPTGISVDVPTPVSLAILER